MYDALDRLTEEYTQCIDGISDPFRKDVGLDLFFPQELIDSMKVKTFSWPLWE